MRDVHPVALFRLAVLGPLASRDQLPRGALKAELQELASHTYTTPGNQRIQLSEKTVQAWYYAWRAGGIEALVPKARRDRGSCKLEARVQEAVLAAKRDHPQRSLNDLRRLLERTGTVARGELSRSAVHRLLARHGLSRPRPGVAVERRSFLAAHAGDIWYGDVMHGPTLTLSGRRRKLYLVSLMDDASRLICHAAFCLGERALDIEGVLKQAVLKRGRPTKLVIDNGSAYRAGSLQGICARLEVRLVYCRPYEPQGKGKLERWHARVRAQFLSELDVRHVRELGDVNARLWAWLEHDYHASVHGALQGKTPWQRWQQDLVRLRPLGPLAAQLDALFYHRHERRVRKDGTVSYAGRFYEVPFELSGKSVVLVVDPHAERALAVESAEGDPLGAVTPLDPLANAHRHRQRPSPAPASAPTARTGPNAVELAYARHHAALNTPEPEEED